MVSRRTQVEQGGAGPAGGGPGAVVRRAPFSDSPHVGARGQRTQQSILDAALRVFGELGYNRARIDQITTRAGCSRSKKSRWIPNRV